jgi:uncharacterized membrane protein
LGAPNEPASKPAEVPARPRPRIETLSDLVFGLALSVGALALVSNPPTTATALYLDIATFGFSFLILIMVWLAYTRIMSVHPLENRRVIALNTVLLFTVSIEPFLFNVLKGPEESTGFFDAVSSAYAADIAVMMTVLGFFAWNLVTVKKPPLAEAVRKSFRAEAINRWIGAAIFLVSIAPVFAQITLFTQILRIWIWIIPLALFRFTHRSFGDQF